MIFVSLAVILYICNKKLAMKRIILGAVMTLLSLGGYAATRTVNVGKFTAIELNSYVNVVFKQQKSGGQATIEGKSNEIVNDVVIEVKGSTLVIDTKNKKWKLGDVRKYAATVTVASPEINGLEVNGSGSLKAGDLKTVNLSMKLNGSGSISAGAVDVSAANVKVNGSGEVSVTTLESTNVSARLNGSGDIEIGNIVSSASVLDLNGSGDVKVNGLKATNVDVRLNGSGDLNIGNCTASAVTAGLSGSGDLRLSGVSATTVTAELEGSGDLTL